MEYRDYQKLGGYTLLQGTLGRLANKEGMLPSEFRKGFPKMHITAEDAPTCSISGLRLNRRTT